MIVAVNAIRKCNARPKAAVQNPPYLASAPRIPLAMLFSISTGLRPSTSVWTTADIMSSVPAIDWVGRGERRIRAPAMAIVSVNVGREITLIDSRLGRLL